MLDVKLKHRNEHVLMQSLCICSKNFKNVVHIRSKNIFRLSVVWCWRSSSINSLFLQVYDVHRGLFNSNFTKYFFILSRSSGLCFHAVSEAITLWKCIMTQFAKVWLIASVGSRMVFKTVKIQKSFVVRLANVFLFSSVSSCMVIQSTLLYKCLLA